MADSSYGLREDFRKHLMRLMVTEMNLLRDASESRDEAMATCHEHGLMILTDMYSYVNRCGRE